MLDFTDNEKICLKDLIKAEEQDDVCFFSLAEVDRLLEHGIVLTNRAVKRGDKFACRLTESGLVVATSTNLKVKGASADSEEGFSPCSSEEELESQDPPEGYLDVDTEVPLPGTRARESKYPFAYMEVGDSFHVAASNREECEALFKTLRSTANSRNRRTAIKDGRKVIGYSKFFRAYRSENDDPKGLGVRVFRLQVDEHGQVE